MFACNPQTLTRGFALQRAAFSFSLRHAWLSSGMHRNRQMWSKERTLHANINISRWWELNSSSEGCRTFFFFFLHKQMSHVLSDTCLFLLCVQVFFCGQGWTKLTLFLQEGSPPFSQLKGALWKTCREAKVRSQAGWGPVQPPDSRQKQRKQVARPFISV